MSNEQGEKRIITILLVDDIPETRENIKKLLAFEPDFKVVGAAANGREGVEMAKELRPDIIIMDINMPDMDGLQAANLITKAVPTAGVIMMSVQTDTDYIRKAMLAGARNFLAKPVNMDELYETVRNVYDQYEPIRQQMSQMSEMILDTSKKVRGEGERAGHIIVVYSPQGGAGCTTIATNLASGLMKEGIKVLLVDADLQFGDVGVFLNMHGQATLLELAESVEDLDTELFENIVMVHDSGLKVLLAPPRPEQADIIIRDNPDAVASILEKVRSNYDFIVVDTSSHLDETLASLLDIATRIVLVTPPTLPGIKNARLMLDLFDQLGYAPEKACLVVNRAVDERQRRQGGISAEKIQSYLKRPVREKIPLVEERIILNAVNKGVPVIAAERDTNKPPTKQYIALADALMDELMGDLEEEADEKSEKSKPGLRLFGR